MKTWEEIRDEAAEMLADGKPLEDVIGNLEKRKNEMAKAELIEAIWQMKNPKPQTNEEWFNALPTEGKAKWLDGLIAYCFGVGHRTETEQKKYQHIVADVEVWLKQPHND